MKKFLVIAAMIFFMQALHAQVRIGVPAPEISLPNAKDSVIALSSLQGKIVLLDFWASWCAPCRRSNKGVEWLYNKYKAEGFEVYGVSLDDKETAWKKAVKKDKLSYMQVHDKMGIYSKAADDYGISEIPSSFLIDKDGTILAINLEGQELKDMIEALLKR